MTSPKIQDDEFGFDDSVAAQLSGAIDPSASGSAPISGVMDPWAKTDELTDDELAKLSQILELRGIQPRQIKIRKTCISAAGIEPGERVLEIGCGTGVVTREVSRAVGATGRVVGLDISKYMLNYAKEITSKTHDEHSAPVEYATTDGKKLPFPDGSFDTTMAVTLLAHVRDQKPIVDEMTRVTRPGGKVLLFDQDYQTLVFNQSQPALTRKILLTGADLMCTDGWVGRKLPGHLVSAGLKHVKCWSFVYVERDTDSYLITIAKRFAQVAGETGAVRKEEADFWLEELMHRGIHGSFLASLNYYFAYGLKT